MNNKLTPYLYVIPLFTAISLLILVPAFGTLVNSFYRDVTFLDKEFIFLKNYFSLFSDSGFIQSLRFTVMFTLISVPFEMALGVMLALLLNEKIPGRGFLRVAVLIPWAIPVAVSGRIWQLIYNYSYGLINTTLLNLGISDTPVNWLGTGTSAFVSLVIADAWKTVPFVAIIILAGLQSIPDEIHEQAKTDGAGIFQRFFLLVLPILRPVIIVALLFRTIDALRIFDIIFVITGGGPGGSTNSLSLYAYNFYLSGDFGAGSAVSVILFFIALILSVVYVNAGKFSEGMK